MAIPAIGHCRVTAKYLQVNNTEANNVWHFSYSASSGATIDETELRDAVAELTTGRENSIAAPLTDDTEFIGCDVYHYDPSTSSFNLIGTTTDTFVGALTGTPISSGTAGLGLIITDQPGVQGKKYTPGVPDSAFASTGLYTTGFTSFILGHMSAFLTQFVSTGAITLDGVVYSKKQGNFFPFSGIRVTNIPAYQRRRKFGRGS